MSPALLNVAALVQGSRVNGPGLRAVVWLQGCDRRPPCPSCYNPGMQDPARAGELLTPDELARRLLAAGDVEGVTFSGGEPFLQAAALARVAARVRARGLTVVVFSGHTLQELRGSGRQDHRDLLAATDLLVDGPFCQDRPCARPLCSSENQRLHFLSGRITLQDLAREPGARLELHIDARGEVLLSGFPDEELLAALAPGDHRRTARAVAGRGD